MGCLILFMLREQSVTTLYHQANGKARRDQYKVLERVQSVTEENAK